MSANPKERKKKPKLVKVAIEAKTPEEERLFQLIKEQGLEKEISEIVRAQMRLSRKIGKVIEEEAKKR